MNGSYDISIDYGRGLIHVMDFDPLNPTEDLQFPAYKLLSMLLMLAPKGGITLEINPKETNN